MYDAKLLFLNQITESKPESVYSLMPKLQGKNKDYHHS